jgi:hypothetical protein
VIVFSETVKAATEIGPLERLTEGRKRPFSLLDESFFKRVPGEDAAPLRVSCLNEGLEGKSHPVAGIPFERRIEEIDGRLTEVVVPRFESAFDATLPEDRYLDSDARQFRVCNEQLKDAADGDPKLRSKFTPEQLEQIKNGDTPDGYVWHHDATPGKLQLVDEMIHMKASHTGGRALWGGGTEHR